MPHLFESFVFIPNSSVDRYMSFKQSLFNFNDMVLFDLLLLLLGLGTTILVDATCFTPNGTDRNLLPDAGEGVYQPCEPFADVSMCCRTGLDVCVENNQLCHNTVSNQYWRESCTDSTWEDRACIKLFVNGTGLNSTVGTTRDSKGIVLADAQLYQCGDGSYCDGGDNKACCDAGEGYFIVNGEQTRQNPNVSSSTTSTSSTTSATTTTSSTTSGSTWTPGSPTMTAPSPVETIQNSSGLSTGAKAAIGVCVAVAALLFMLLGLWWFRRRSRRERDSSTYMTDQTDSRAPALEIGSGYQKSETVEPPISQEKRTSEMDARYTPQELPITRD